MRNACLLLSALAVFACGGDSTGPAEEALEFGTLQVTLTRAADAALLLFSASVKVGSGQPIVIKDGETGTFPDLLTGTHSLEASDLTGSCTYHSPYPENVSITANQITQVDIVVTCDFDPEPRILFVWHREGWRYDLFSVKPDGSDLRQLTEGGGNLHPSWSPDGTRIAYARGTEIWIMNFDGTERRRLFPDYGLNPAWSPDGERVAYTGGPPSASTILIRRVGGSGEAQGTQSAPKSSWASWSHDGGTIAYCNDSDGLAVMDANGTGVVVLTNGGKCLSPSWSPDDLTLAFSYGGPRGDTPFQIWRIGADGSDLQKLTDMSSPCTGSEYLPDGSGIVFHCRQNSLPEGLEEALIMDTDGSNQRLFTPLPQDGAHQVRYWGGTDG